MPQIGLLWGPGNPEFHSHFLMNGSPVSALVTGNHCEQQEQEGSLLGGLKGGGELKRGWQLTSAYGAQPSGSDMNIATLRQSSSGHLRGDLGRLGLLTCPCEAG